MKKIILIFCIISFSCAQLLGMQQAVNIAAESAEQRGHKRHAQGQEVADAGAASPVQKARSESPKPQEVVIASPEKLDIPINIGAIKVLPRDITTQLKAIYQSTEISLKKSFGLDDSNPLECELYPLLPLDPHHQKKREEREKKVQKIRSKLFYHQGLIFVLQYILVEFQLKYIAEDQKKSTRRTITTCLLGPDEEKIITAATPPNYDRVSDLLEILKEDPFLKRLLPEKCTEIWQQEQASIPAFIKVLVKNHTSKTAIYKHPEKLFSDYILPQITRKHLEEISSTEDNLDSYPKVYFNPRIIEVLYKLVSDEKKAIDAAYYHFTDEQLAKLMGQKQSQLIVHDKSGPAIKLLLKNNTPVMVSGNTKRFKTGDKKFEQMHHKFMILHENLNGKTLLVTGSFNPTEKSIANNNENIVIIDDPVAITKFVHEFQALKSYSEIVKQESDPEPSQQTEVSTILDHEETSIKIMGLCVEPHVISDLREMQNQINQILGLCSATTDNILFHALTSHDPHSGTKSKIREEVVKKLIDQNIEPQIIMRAIQCLLIDHQIKSRTSDDMHATLKQPKYEEIIPVLELLKKDCTNPEHLLSQQIWEKTVVTTYQEANKLFAIQSNSERFKTAFFPEKIVTDEQYQSIQKEVRDIFDKEDELDRYGAKAYFTPDINSTFKPDLISILVKLVSDEQTGISAAYFRFTHHDLAQAFIKKSAELKKTLVSNPVQLIVDQKFNEDHCYALKMLFDNNIPVMCNGEKKRFDGHKTEEYLHHKFMILHKNKDQKSLLVTGSFNPTGQANTNSSENIIIIDDSIAIRKFLHEFQILKKHARTIEPTECEQGKTFGSEHAVVINGFDPKNFGFGP